MLRSLNICQLNPESEYTNGALHVANDTSIDYGYILYYLPRLLFLTVLRIAIRDYKELKLVIPYIFVILNMVFVLSIETVVWHLFGHGPAFYNIRRCITK